MMLINYHFTKYYLMIMLSFCYHMSFTVIAAEQDDVVQEEERQTITPNEKEIMSIIEVILKDLNIKYNRLTSRNAEQGWSENSDWPIPAVVSRGSNSNCSHSCGIGVNGDTSIFLACWSPFLKASNLQEGEAAQAIVANIDQSHQELEMAEQSTKGQWRAPSLQSSTDMRLITLTYNLVIDWNTVTKQDFTKILRNSRDKFNTQFNAEAKQLSFALPLLACPAPSIVSPFVINTVRQFLQEMGYTDIRERDTSHGKSLLVCACLNPLSLESPEYNNFPIKVDITNILVFRIYLSYNNAAETFPHNAWRNYMQDCVARWNQDLPVGYWNYSSNSNQVQMTIKLNYKLLQSDALRNSVASIYDYICTEYIESLDAIKDLRLN